MISQTRNVTRLIGHRKGCVQKKLPQKPVVFILAILYYRPDLGRFRLRSRNQTTIPTPIPESESESESFVVHFGGVGIGVGIVVIGIGIGVGIVVIGIGVGIGIRWRFHTFMYRYHLTFIQKVTPRKALSHRVRNTARWKWICLFRVDCCAVCISMYSMQACQLILFNNGPQQLDFYFCSVHSKETVGLIGQIWPNWVNPVLWCYNAAK